MNHEAGRRIFRGIFILLTLVVGAWSCGTDEVRSQSSRLTTNLELDPGEDADFVVDFGEVAIGAAASKRFSLGNDGSVELLIVSSEPAAPFSLSPASGEFQLPAGGSTWIEFRFQPELESTASQILTLSTNEGPGGREYRIRLEGVGVQAALACDRSSLDFGVIVRGNVSSQRVSCTNSASFPIEVGELAFRGIHAPFLSARFVGGTNQVPSGGTIEFEVTLRAESLGMIEAWLEARAIYPQLLASLRVTAEVVTSEVSIEPPGCLDFSFVEVGDTGQRTLTLRNLGREPIQLQSVEVAGEDPSDFSVLTSTSLVLAPDGGVGTLEIEFQPSKSGARSAVLSLQTDEPGAAPLQVCVKGVGGGPALSCTPEVHDFGAVAVGVPSTVFLRCSNTGTAPESEEEAAVPLFLSSVSSDSDRFQVSVRNEDESTGPKAAGYQIGESFFLEVVYAPMEESFDAAEIRVQTNSTMGLFNVSGQGRVLPPCEISIVTPSLQFGVVDRGAELTRTFEIRNLLSGSCLIRDLRLSDDSDPAYSLTPIDVHELGGHDSLPVSVRFAPTTYAPSLRGNVEFEISNPGDRFQTVQLDGAAGQACLLIEPAAIDYGNVTPGCTNQGRKVVFSNACATSLTVTAASVEGPQSEDFHIIGMPSFPRVLGPQQWVEATLAFLPNRLGRHLAALELQVEVASSGEELFYVASLEGNGATSGRQTDEFIQKSRPAIDILWVIDNSSSMNPFQERLRENLPAFLTFANQRQSDFQIGVTSAALKFGGSGCPGGADGEENGRLFPVDGKHPRILRPNTPDLEDHWRHNMTVGTCWELFGETPMEAALRALSVPLINEAKDSRYPWSPYQDGNAGFLRPEAMLSIILVGDEDYSQKTPMEYANFFIGLKRGNRNMVRVHGITGPREFGPGPRCNTSHGDRLMDLIEATDGTWLNICTPTGDTNAWSSALEEMSSGVFNVAERWVLRSEPADRSENGRKDEADLEVRVNGVLLPPIDPGSQRQIWRYDPLSNAIYFEPRFLPSAGAKITASYDLECL